MFGLDFTLALLASKFCSFVFFYSAEALMILAHAVEKIILKTSIQSHTKIYDISKL